MSPDIGIKSKKYLRGWDAIFDFAVYLSKSIQKHIDVADPLSLYGRFTSNEEEDIFSPENVLENDVSLENMFEEEKENLEEERKKLRDSFKNITESFDKRSKIREALMTIWSKIISESRTLRVIQKVGERLYEKIIQRFLPFDFDEGISPLESIGEETLFDSSRIVEVLNERIKESMRSRVKTVIQNRL